MTFPASLKRDWLSNIRADVLAGIVVALALIPEAIGFSIIAGVDPRVGLYASVAIAIVISFTGGRPGMISAATAAVAANKVKTERLLATIRAAGIRVDGRAGAATASRAMSGSGLSSMLTGHVAVR